MCIFLLVCSVREAVYVCHGGAKYIRACDLCIRVCTVYTYKSTLRSHARRDREIERELVAGGAGEKVVLMEEEFEFEGLALSMVQG